MRASVFALILSAPACADDGMGDSDGLQTGRFDTEVQPVFDTWCLCHMQGPDGTMEADYMQLNAPAIDRLVDVASVEVPEMARIAPGDRQRSYLWHKISGTHESVGGTGDSMPPTLTLSAEDKETIGRWIDDGASR